MNKVFRKRTDHLRVTVTKDAELFLPSEDGNKDIGTYEQTTIQKIRFEEVDVLRKFILSEKEKGELQLTELKKQFEPLKDVEENMSEEFMQTAIEGLKVVLDKARYKKVEVKEGEEPTEPTFDKGAHEEAMNQLKELNSSIGKIQQKKALLEQIKFFEEQVAATEKDFKDLNKAMQ